MQTYVHNFKDKHGNLVSDQEGVKYAVDKLGEDVLNERHLYSLYYGVNSAVTKRWTSAFHGIPANADVKGVFIPHFKNGYFLHADFSAAEYRVFAALAKEAAIVQAFREGKDIHRFIASKLYKKPEEEISGVERSVAKKLSFGLLYGKGIPAIAEEYFRGDVAYAQSLFDMFFDMFPRVQAYIEEQKEILFANREVYTVFGDAIKIDFDEKSPASVAEGIRFAGNYPTQSSASSTAALVTRNLSFDAKRNGWPMKFPGFIHDCSEGSVGGSFLIESFEIVPRYAETWPYETFGFPMTTDIELGVRGGPFLTEWKRLKGETKFVKDGKIYAKVEGEKEALNQLLDRIKSNGYKIEMDKVKEEEVFNTWSDLYMKSGSAFRLAMGTNSTHVSMEVEVSQ